MGAGPVHGLLPPQSLHWRDLGRVVPGGAGVPPQPMSGEKSGSPSRTVHCTGERGEVVSYYSLMQWRRRYLWRGCL